MRLGVLLDRFEPAAGGAEVHTTALLRRAVETGEEAVLATVRGEAGDGVRTLHVPVPRRRPARDRRFAVDGERALRDAGCDVVLALRHALRCDVYLPHGGLVADGLAAWDRARGRRRWWRAARRRLSARVRFFLEAEAALLGGADGPRVICVSRLVADRVRAAHPGAARRLVVIPHGVDAERFDPARAGADRERWRREHGLERAYVGLLAARHPVLKGLATALEALARPEVRELDPPFHLLLAGGAVPRALGRRARHAGVQDRVHVLGAWSDLRPVLAAADVLVHPTWHDPCSLVCLEALAMARPVITTPHNGVREVLGMRGGIVIEEAGNAEALAVAIRVLADEALRAATAEDARELALAHREATSLDRMLDVCRSMASRS